MRRFKKSILAVLERENRWMSFDELFSRVQPDCGWVVFALQLERMVQCGEVQYILPHGADTGCYGRKDLTAKQADLSHNTPFR